MLGLIWHFDTNTETAEEAVPGTVIATFSSQNGKPRLLKVLDGVWREDSEGQCSSQGTTAKQPEEDVGERSSSAAS